MNNHAICCVTEFINTELCKHSVQLIILADSQPICLCLCLCICICICICIRICIRICICVCICICIFKLQCVEIIVAVCQLVMVNWEMGMWCATNNRPCTPCTPCTGQDSAISCLALCTLSLANCVQCVQWASGHPGSPAEWMLIWYRMLSYNKQQSSTSLPLVTSHGDRFTWVHMLLNIESCPAVYMMYFVAQWIVECRVCADARC